MIELIKNKTPLVIKTCPQVCFLNLVLKNKSQHKGRTLNQVRRVTVGVNLTPTKRNHLRRKLSSTQTKVNKYQVIKRRGTLTLVI